ncbi:hypothetical protein L0337_18845 [candidate division KSB1 bacterium]|nr:hypothetical protein [candidate division KSB1 bacterium]
MSILSKTDCLLLLIGGNPLPNAVAAMLLADHNGRIVLVHSKDTYEIATRLRQWLRDRGFSKAQFELVEIKESDPALIVQRVGEYLTTVNTKNIGLHYTGGTKTMSVHAYRTVERWAKASGVIPSLTYLDARSLKMVLDPKDPESGELTQEEHVGRALRLLLSDLLGLHNWKFLHPPNIQAILPDTAQALADVNVDSRTVGAWVTWKRETLHRWCRRDDRPDKWKSKGALNTVQLPLPTEMDLQKVVSTIRGELGQAAGDLSIAAAATSCGCREPEIFCDWLDGKWLEHHVLSILKSLSTKLELHDCAQNIETLEVRFDLDVTAMRGYQLFAFSCSTDRDNSRLKHRLFEAVVRARQLGGDEARVALVCSSDEPDKLQKEIRRDLDPHACVFGRKHMSILAAEIEKWIRSQSGEE